MRTVSICFVVALTALTLGCNRQAERRAERKETRKEVARAGDAKKKATETSQQETSKKEDSKTQKITVETGEGKATVESDGQTVKVKTADGKEMTVDVSKAKAMSGAMAKAKGKKRGDAETKSSETEETESSGESENAEVAKITTNEGTFTYGQNQAPKDMPIEVYKGAKITYSAHMAPSAQSKDEIWQVHFQTEAAPKDVAAFYDQIMRNEGIEVQRVEQQMGGQSMTMLTGENDENGCHLTITFQDKECAAMLVWTKKGKKE